MAIGSAKENLNTSYVKVKLLYILHLLYYHKYLNTSYVKVKPQEISTFLYTVIIPITININTF